MSKKRNFQNKTNKPQTIQENKPENIFIPVKLPKIAYLIVFLLAGILYINSIQNEYALDDSIVVTANAYTKKGFAGIKEILTTNYLSGMYGGQKMRMYEGDRYRPLSIVLLAIEYEFFGENPKVSHIVNILMYALTAFLLLWVLNKLFNLKQVHSRFKAWFFSIPFVVSLLFIAHPVHTEVVANIKGSDELMSFLGVLAALIFIIKYLENKKIKNLLLSGVFYFLSLMSKESGIMFIFILPLIVYFFTDISFKGNFKICLPSFIAALAFILIRQAIVGGFDVNLEKNLMTHPYLEASVQEKFATIFYCLGLYIKLLFFPHPLTFDYYPYHIPLIKWLDLRAIIPLAIYMFLGIYALKNLPKKSLLSFCILYYLVLLSIFSNIFFNIGVFMNERFLYASSLGFCIIIGYFLYIKLPELTQKKNIPVKYVQVGSSIILGVLLILFSIKTISRNPVWKNNFTLFTTDVKTSENSLKSTAAAGEKLLSMARREKDSLKRLENYNLAIKYFTKTVEIFPQYIYVLMYLGEAHYEAHRDVDSAFYYFKRVLKIRPDYEATYKDIQNIFKQYQNVDYQIKTYEELYKINPYRFDILNSLGILYGAYKNDLNKSIFYLEQALKVKPDDINTYADLGVAYGMSGRINDAINIFEKGFKRDPNNSLLTSNLARAYQQVKNIERANYYFTLTRKLENINKTKQ